MKILNVKTAIAVVCVVAAGFGGVKAYNAANQSEADLLLAENVEALTAGENKPWGYHKSSGKCSGSSKSWVTCGTWEEGGDPNCQNSDC